jgi:hypothetical protein
MLTSLLDLEKPIISSKMVDFLEHDGICYVLLFLNCILGVYDILLNFITRLHDPPNEQTLPVQVKNDTDGVTLELVDGETTNIENDTEMDEELTINRRSWKAIDLLSKPTSTAFAKSIENHLPYMLERIFIDSFAPENTRCNYFHIQKLMENLLTNHRARIFEVLRRKDLVMKCIIPVLYRHPVIVHMLLYLIEMSQPLTSSNGSNFVIKRRFQAHLAQEGFIHLIMQYIYNSQDEQCEAACEFFTRFVNELCVQEKGRQVQFERNRRNEKERVAYLGKEYIEQEKQEKANERRRQQLENGGTDNLDDEEELDCVGELLKSLNAADDDLKKMFQVLLDWENTSFTSRQCCARVFLFLMERTHPENNEVVLYTEHKTKWMEEAEEEEEEEVPVPPNLVTMKVLHEHIMETMLENLGTICNIINSDYKHYKNSKTGIYGVKLSAYNIGFGFTTLRLDLIRILYRTIRYMYEKYIDEMSTPFASVLQDKENVLSSLIDWFFDYRFNNMYHNLFTELICELITNGEFEVLECILEKNDFLSRMIRTYMGDEITDNRAHIMHLANVLRLMLDTLDPKSYMYRYLKNHAEWKIFVPILKKQTLFMLRKEDESEIEIGSDCK